MKCTTSCFVIAWENYVLNYNFTTYTKSKQSLIDHEIMRVSCWNGRKQFCMNVTGSQTYLFSVFDHRFEVYLDFPRRCHVESSKAVCCRKKNNQVSSQRRLSRNELQWSDGLRLYKVSPVAPSNSEFSRDYFAHFSSSITYI